MSDELLAQITAVCERAAEGDLEARIAPAPEDPGWNRMCRAINHLLDMVDSYVRESEAVLQYCGRHEYYRPILVRGLHGAYGSAAATINKAALEMECGHRELESASEQRQRLISDVSLSAQSVAAACEELTATSSEISSQLNKSASLTDDAVGQSVKAKESVRSLAGNAERIQSVVKLINDIASQTNLLALNATIEAARAGEQGKGFAVVAQEVKSLSRNTAKATETIADQVQSMVTATNHMERAITLINGSIESINENVSVIAHSVQDQVKATQEIAGRMNNVSARFSLI